ncbi:hypothetical protein RND81_07G040900 [Saponaria officinalis]|uniref:Cytochrome c domain-containing protein n=1 Tax=Saponaria officinalis TaxID=3572 RepID=A0AAW1JQG9_SAPOF
MATFSEAPAGNVNMGEKIFKTKCAQCHTIKQGAGHKQGTPYFSNIWGRIVICLYFGSILLLRIKFIKFLSLIAILLCCVVVN